jgi:glutamate dehydrogenase
MCSAMARLLSRNMRLVAAFNHRHIFIDPTPDAKTSYAERERLFKLPRSGWNDYNAKLISKGGAVFERSAKSITLTNEMRACLGTDAKTATPDELIRIILKAPVELLWNGGIGTYVKAASETHDQVGDRANNSLRVDGAELRCAIVGEGGNLGFTQRGRIEYARKGGRINTDAIDNSGGVDCSDHEVNIKIALGAAVATKRMTLKARDSLLKEHDRRSRRSGAGR